MILSTVLPSQGCAGDGSSGWLRAGRERGLAGKTSRLFLKSNVEVSRVSGCQDTRPLAVVTSRPRAIAGRGGMVAARGGFVFLGQHRDIGFGGGPGLPR